MSYDSINKKDLNLELLLDWSWDDTSWWWHNATISNGSYIDNEIWFQKEVLLWGASTTLTYSSITYTNSYIWIDWIFTKNSSEVTATWINWTDWKSYGMLRLFDRTLTESEEQALYLEWKRKLWQNNYPDLFKWCVAYYDMSGDWSDIVWWNNWTVNWATLTTDRFWMANRAYNFDWSNDYISIPNLLTFQSEVKELLFYTTIKRDVIWGVRTIFQARLQSWNSQWLDIFFRDDNKIQIRITSDSWIQWRADTINSYTSTSDYLKIILIRNSARWYSLYINWVKQTLENGTNASLSDSNTIITSTNTFSWMTDVIDIWAFWSWGNCCYFDWQIENTIIRDRALSEAEVEQLYTLQNTKYPLPRTKSSVPSLSDWLVLNIDWTHDWTTYFDQSGNWNNWTWSNVIDWWRIGEHKIMEFNGSSSSIDCWSFTFAKQNTISIRLKYTDSSNIMMILNENVDYQARIYLNDTWDLQTYFWDYWWSNPALGANFTNSKLYDWNWHNIIIEQNFTTNTVDYYLDMIKQTTIYTSQTIQNIPLIVDNLYIWADKRQSRRYYNWELPSLKIRNRALTEKEIQQEYYRNFIPS